jgi:hypothetical protein
MVLSEVTHQPVDSHGWVGLNSESHARLSAGTRTLRRMPMFIPEHLLLPA